MIVICWELLLKIFFGRLGFGLSVLYLGVLMILLFLVWRLKVWLCSGCGLLLMLWIGC